MVFLILTLVFGALVVGRAIGSIPILKPKKFHVAFQSSQIMLFEKSGVGTLPDRSSPQLSGKTGRLGGSSVGNVISITGFPMSEVSFECDKPYDKEIHACIAKFFEILIQKFLLVLETRLKTKLTFKTYISLVDWMMTSLPPRSSHQTPLCTILMP